MIDVDEVGKLEDDVLEVGSDEKENEEDRVGGSGDLADQDHQST